MSRTQLHFRQLPELAGGPERECFIYADAIDGVFQRGRTNLTLQVGGHWIEVIGDYRALTAQLEAVGRFPDAFGAAIRIDSPATA